MKSEKRMMMKLSETVMKKAVRVWWDVLCMTNGGGGTLRWQKQGPPTGRAACSPNCISDFVHVAPVSGESLT